MEGLKKQAEKEKLEKGKLEMALNIRKRKIMGGRKEEEQYHRSGWNGRHDVKVFKGTRRWGNKRERYGHGGYAEKRSKKDMAIWE